MSPIIIKGIQDRIKFFPLEDIGHGDHTGYLDHSCLGKVKSLTFL